MANTKLSLWLCPPVKSHFNTTLTSFMQDRLLEKFFPNEEKYLRFSPHVTITSGFQLPSPQVDSGSEEKGGEKNQEAQKWLDGLDLPAKFKPEKNEVVCELAEVVAGKEFFQKLYMLLTKNDNLLELAATLRRQCSSRSPDSESSTRLASEKGERGGGKEEAVRWAKEEYMPHLSLFYGSYSQSSLELILERIKLDLGFQMGDLFSCCGGSLAMGGRLVLVDTTSDREVEGWKVVAEREVKWINWRMGKDLL